MNELFRLINKAATPKGKLPWPAEWALLTQSERDAIKAKIASAQVPQDFGYGHDEQQEFEERDQDYDGAGGMKR